VLNKSDAASGIKPGDVETILRQSLSASIASDPKLVPYAANQGVPFVSSNRDAIVSKSIMALARMVTVRTACSEPEPVESTASKNGKNRVSRLFGGLPLRRRETVSELRS
jgi:Flp pilus assembly CpaE family ATPase